MQKVICKSVIAMSWAWLTMGTAFVDMALADDEKPKAESKPIAPAEVNLGRPVDFEQDIVPIFDNNCVACHNVADSESKFNIEEVQSIMTGGKRGPSVVPKEPEKSLLYLVASRAKEPHMPPLPNNQGAEALTPEELGLLRQWILEGATAGMGGASESISFRPLPEDLHPIYSVALSPWGRLAAAGRSNQITIYDVATGEELSRLTDPHLNDLKFDEQPMYPAGAAHRDFVQSLAFSPDGTMLASGGYRVVKLWKRDASHQTRKVQLPAEATAVAVRADGQQIAVAVADNTIHLINTADCVTAHVLSGHTARVSGLEFWPSLEEQATLEAAARNAARNSHTATKAAQKAALEAEAYPQDEKRTAAKTEADKAVQTAGAALKAAQDAQAAFAKKAAEGSILVSASHDKSLRVWNPADGSLRTRLVSPAAVNDAAFSVDAARIVSADADNTVRVWDTAGPSPDEPAFAVKPGQAEPADKPVLELKGHAKPATSVAIVRPAGAQLVTGSEDGTVRVWNLADGKEIRKMDHAGPVTSIAVRPDGQAIASGGTNNIARLWQFSDGKQLAEMKGSLGTRRHLAELTESETVSKNHFTLADAAFKAGEAQKKERDEALKKATEAKPAADKAVTDATAKQKETADKLTAAKAELEKKKDDEAVKKAAAEAEKAATDANAALKSAMTGQANAAKAIERSQKAATAAKAKVEQLTAAKTAADEKQKQATAAKDEATKTDVASAKPIRNVAFSPDGKLLATAGDDGVTHVWNAASGKPLRAHAGHEAAVHAVSFGTGHAFVSCGADKTLSINTPSYEWKLAGTLGPAGEDPLDLSGSQFVSRILALDFSDDGQLLATGGGDPSRSGELIIWNIESMSLVREIAEAHSDTVLGLEFSRDRTYLVSSAADKFVKVFEVETGKHVRSFEGHTHHVLDVSWKADGSSIASAGADNAIKVWNVETGEQRRTIGGYGKQVTSIQYMGVGDNIVSAGGDKTVRMHTTSNGKNYRNFAGGTDFMYASAASRDETVVVAGGEDGVLRIWNGADAKVLYSFNPPQ